MKSITMLTTPFLSLWAVVLILLLLLNDAAAGPGRFAVTGPVLTVTLKDPDTTISNSRPSSLDGDGGEEGGGNGNQWLNLSSFRPNLIWSIQSQGSSKPLPEWLPSLQSLRGTIGYNYEENKKSPSFLEADVKFSKSGINLDIQPSYEFKHQRSQWLVQVSKGATYLMTKLSSAGDRWVEVIRGCYQANLPYASIGGIRITPQYDFRNGEASCLLEGTTGSQRTKAVLNLEYNNPTLSIVHALDERHVIAPEISLYNAKIIYQWNIALQSGSIRTKVDPTSAIHVTWTDKSMTGKWVTDFRLPLAGTTLSALAADVRVRRQFAF